jgi:hypothetical protein
MVFKPTLWAIEAERTGILTTRIHALRTVKTPVGAVYAEGILP